MEPPLQSHFEHRRGCLVVRSAGRDLIERKQAVMQTIMTAIKAHQSRALLVDFRGVTGPITFLDRFEIGEMAGRYLVGLPLAALAHDEQTDKGRIGQTVAANRGALVEVFTDPAVADAWLEKHADPQLPPEKTT